MSLCSVAHEFWRGRRVLVTGHTGFKGAWLSIWLTRMGAKVFGASLAPDTEPNLFELAGLERIVQGSRFLDIRAPAALSRMVKQVEPEVIFHLAAQALVRRSYDAPVETFATNVMGTVHLLEAIRSVESVRAAVIVTTDKVYANREWCWPYREGDVLGGHDPYSASKAVCELVVDSYRKAFLASRGVPVATARAGNVIGGGDWSRDRLFPDAIAAWIEGKALQVRRPQAIRPWQHVLEPVSAYLVLAQALWAGQAQPEAYNIGPFGHEAATVRQVIELARQCWADVADVEWGSGETGPHEAGLLALDATRARHVLGLTPKWRLETAVNRTVCWYRHQALGRPAMDLCHADIDAFEGADLRMYTP